MDKQTDCKLIGHRGENVFDTDLFNIWSESFFGKMYNLRCEICTDKNKIKLYKGEHFIGEVVEDKNDVNVILRANEAYRTSLSFTEMDYIQKAWKQMKSSDEEIY